MVRSEIRTEFMQRAPDSPVTTAQMDLWSQRGVNHIARLLKLFPTSGDINLVASTQSYDLLTNFTLFLKLNLKGGVLYYDGTDYSPLKQVNRSWLDQNVQGWENSDTGTPKACFKEGLTLFLYPTPSSTLTAGLKVYYYSKPTQMTADSSEPFNSRGDLDDLQEAIILYMLWKAKQAMGEYTQAEMAKNEFYGFLRESDLWVAEDEEVVNEIFRPYHLGSPSSLGDISSWGVE